MFNSPQEADREAGEADAEVDLERRGRWTEHIAAGQIIGFDLLADYGIAVVPSRAASALQAALACADAIGYPVALKTRGALHKSDVGGVVLGIADEAALSSAYAAISDRLGPEVSIDAMVAPGDRSLSARANSIA